MKYKAGKASPRVTRFIAKMKLILSRKGFDSEFGGCPSPILSDDELISFPIPANEEISFSKGARAQ